MTNEEITELARAIAACPDADARRYARDDAIAEMTDDERCAFYDAEREVAR